MPTEPNGRPTAQLPAEPAIHVDKAAIRTSLHARVSYLINFIGLSSADVEVLHDIAPQIRPAIPGIVATMYQKLWSYDITREALQTPNNPHLPRDDVSLQKNERIRYLSSFMNHWVLKIFIADWEDLQTFAYFDRVGLTHIGEGTFRHRGERGPLLVDYVHIGALLGVLTESLTRSILALEKPTLEEKTRILSALTKVMWIQNDLMSRHYIPPVETILPPKPVNPHGTVHHDPNEPRCPFGRPPVEEPEYADEPWPDDSDEEEELKSESSDEDESTKVGAATHSSVDSDDEKGISVAPNGRGTSAADVARLEDRMREVELRETI